MTKQEQEWSERSRASVVANEPSPGLLKALEILGSNNTVVIPGSAIDLGCGFGRDTRKLLTDGWRVLAVDICETSILRMEESCADIREDRLTTQLASFAETNWRLATLINASLTLPYCPKDEFGYVWSQILAALIPGGVIVADFFGHLPGAPMQEPMVMLFSEAELERFFSPLKVEFYQEWYGDFINASDEIVRRVAYTIVARHTF
jgi:SAM-dependent methyltransferase